MTPTFSELKKNLKKDFSKFKKLRVAVLADSATQFLVAALRGYGYEQKLNLDIYEADFDEIDRQIFDKSSKLHKFKPGIIIIFESFQNLSQIFYKLSRSQKRSFALFQKKRLLSVYKTLTRSGAKIIYFNFPFTNDAVFGNYALKTEESLSYQFSRFNSHLLTLSKKCKDLFLYDFDSLIKKHGEMLYFDPKFYVNSSVILGPNILPFIAKGVIDIIEAIGGGINKCIILDLDNTLWGGIVGDDGWENIQLGELGIGKAYSQLQLWLKQLKNRGIILAVASKNDRKIAKEAFLKHPDMVLKLEDFAVFIANWNSKIDNVGYIQKFLNISFDSIIFLDDNPREREVIRKSFPQITVPELPDDPTLYLSYLQELNLFETTSVSTEDKKRTRHYQQEGLRSSFSKSFSNELEFLKNLSMVATVRPFSVFDIPRVAQLTQRSNQFNLRTIRYSEEEVTSISKSKNYLTLSVSLKDKFGDLGLISVIILENRKVDFFVDTWIMSCRVLKRGVEDLVMTSIINLAKKYKISSVVGEYIPTAKNGLVKDHYSRLGFKRQDNFWKLEEFAYKPKNFYIKVI